MEKKYPFFLDSRVSFSFQLLADQGNISLAIKKTASHGHTKIAVLQFVGRKWQNVFTPFGYKVQIRLIMSMFQSGIDVTPYNQNKK